MKIAHVTATFPPYLAGTGNVAYHNARLLHERGHEVTVFTAEAGGAQRSSRASFPFPVRRLPTTLRFGNAPLTPGLAGKLRGFDLIHLHYPYIFGAELALFAAARFRIPLVLTYHNRLEEETRLKRLLFGLYNRTAEPLILACARKLLAVRRGHLVNLHPKLGSSAKLSELSNGVDCTLFRPHDKRAARRALGLPPVVPVALFVGALDGAHRFKNVRGLLRAFAQLSLPEAQLLIVGEGELRGSFEQLSRELGVASRVRFLGRRPPEALPAIYSAADVSVLPSTAVESFGLVLVESMACGTPVITTTLPGVKDAVKNGFDGLLVNPGDDAGLAAALGTMLSEPQRTACMGARARLKVEAAYDWNAIGRRLEGLYLEVLGEA